MQLKAQTARVRPIEFEIRYGLDAPLERLPHSDKSLGFALGMELRYNFKDSPMDLGVTIDFTSAYYEFKQEPETLEQFNSKTLIGITSDYNFRQGGKVNPFVGLGVGLGVHDALMDVVDDTNDCNNTIAIAPRCGVELWRHLRLTLAANISCKYYNNISLTVGCVFGGGKKKQ